MKDFVKTFESHNYSVLINWFLECCHPKVLISDILNPLINDSYLYSSMASNSLDFVNEFRIIVYMIKSFTISKNYKKELKDLNSIHPKSNILRLAEWIEDFISNSIKLLFN